MTDPSSGARVSETGGAVVSGWQPIETAPVGEDVALYSPDSDCPVVIGHLFKPGDDWYPQHETTFHGGCFDIGFTHWQPLPEPPEPES